MKRLLVLFLLLGMLWPAFAVADVNWLTLKDGLEKAKAEGKPVIVDFFYGTGCPRCERLQKAVYEEPAIGKRIVEEFVPVRIDLTQKLSPEEEELGRKYDFKNDCLLLFLDKRGEIIKGPEGKRLCFIDSIEPEVFLQYLDMIKTESSGK
jgi:thioredoxin-related protein